MKLYQALSIIILFGLTACSSAPPVPPVPPVPQESKEYIQFTEQKNYSKTYAIYADNKLLSESNNENTFAKVDLDLQRIRLIVNGLTAVDSPATTGKKDFDTPIGIFGIIDKLAVKESNLYGKFYKEDKLVFTGSEKEYEEEHDGEKLEYDTYKGASLDNWLRLTRDGVGIHKSKNIYRHPASHGCVRVPNITSNLLFTKLHPGSIVKVIKKSNEATTSVKDDKNNKIHSDIKTKTSYKDSNLPAKQRLKILREYKKSKTTT